MIRCPARSAQAGFSTPSTNTTRLRRSRRPEFANARTRDTRPMPVILLRQLAPRSAREPGNHAEYQRIRQTSADHDDEQHQEADGEAGDHSARRQPLSRRIQRIGNSGAKSGGRVGQRSRLAHHVHQCPGVYAALRLVYAMQMATMDPLTPMTFTLNISGTSDHSGTSRRPTASAIATATAHVPKISTNGRITPPL